MFMYKRLTDTQLLDNVITQLRFYEDTPRVWQKYATLVHVVETHAFVHLWEYSIVQGMWYPLKPCYMPESL